MSYAAVPPGWYPDPWYPQSMRWWDGATWTEHAQWAASWATPVDPNNVERWAKRARLAFWAVGICSAITAIVLPLVIGSTFDRSFDSFGTESDPTFSNGYLVGNLALQPVGLAQLAFQIVLAIWSHHITTTARSIGLRTTHSPGWAIAGWFVPIVNFWFPYQVVRDALPPGHPERTKLGLWWTLHVSTQFAAIFAFFGAIASTGIGAVVGLAAAGASLGAAYLGAALAQAIGESHVGAVTGTAATTPL